MEESLREFPHITRDGQWLTHENGHWTGGFWVGLLWLKSLYAVESERAQLQTKAAGWAKRLAVRVTDNKTHDQGFIFGPSCILGYHLTGDPEFIRLAEAGAKNMRDLFEDRVGLILAWDEPGYEGVAIVDTIMNLPLLSWVAKQQDKPEYHELACHTADHILQHHVRPDGSTYHVVRWDPSSYEIVERRTHQGFAPESCWSRGQAWATYGFANMYRYTKKAEYLEAAQKIGEYYWDHLDDDLKLPRWDFVFQNRTDEPLDASSASIAASGMILMYDLLKQAGSLDADIWLDRADQILQGMATHCLYHDMERFGIIEKATVDKPRNSGINESTMYGDYYFMEAIYRRLQLHEGNRKGLEILY
nr:glycoside hydrolase family 88 protein [Ammoniphilus resinae]